MLLMPTAPPSYPLPKLGVLRVRKAFTQDFLAQRSGVGRATIARIERGEPARLGTIRRLAEALEVQPAELMASE
jgi:transcriptional regulator with XRE-family HTH domain